MATYSIIQKSQLEGAHRIDAEYYQPEYLEKAKKLKTIPTIKLSEIAYITDGEHGSPIWDENSGIKYFSAQHVKDSFIDDSEVNTVSKIIDARNERSRLKSGDLLLSTVGTIGNAGLVTEDLLPANIDRHVARIALKENTLDPEFLVAFLNSTYGKFQSVRESTGNVQLNLFIDKIKKILIPKNNNVAVSKLINSAFDGRNLSEKLYSEAEQFLLEELGLGDFEPRDDLSFVVNLSEVKKTDRADSYFFHPKFDEILQRLKSHKPEPLDNHFDVLRSKNFIYTDDGEIGVIKTKQLGKQFINFEVEDRTSNETVQKERLPIVGDSDVIFASMGVGSLGKTNIFYNFETASEKYTIDSTLRIFRSIKSSNILPEVLTVYLSCSIGQELIYKYIVGTSGIISIYENYLREFSVPILTQSVQQKIADLVKKSHEARKKSKELLEEAKRKVEEMIEKGGED